MAAQHADAIHAVLQTIRPDLPYVMVRPLAESIRSAILPFRLGAMLFSMFSALALVLACVGLCGVLGYFVTERTAEIGIRRSLGAPLRSVVLLVGTAGNRSCWYRHRCRSSRCNCGHALHPVAAVRNGRDGPCVVRHCVHHPRRCCGAGHRPARLSCRSYRSIGSAARRIICGLQRRNSRRGSLSETPDVE